MMPKLYSLKKKVPPRLVVQVVQERKLCKQALRHHAPPPMEDKGTAYKDLYERGSSARNGYLFQASGTLCIKS